MNLHRDRSAGEAPSIPTQTTGTTTVGIVAKDGVVLASERRVTAGSMIANKTFSKVFKIDPNIGMTVAGSVGDAQVVVRYLRAEVALYRLRSSSPLSAEGAATVLAGILSSGRMYPYYGWFILGGVDPKGGHVFSVDPAGGSIEDRYVSIGSGSTFAYGVLEEVYGRDISVSDGVALALRSLTVAMKRDSASGDGYTVSAITPKEYREFSDEEINKRLKSLKIPLPPVLP